MRWGYELGRRQVTDVIVTLVAKVAAGVMCCTCKEWRIILIIIAAML
jgi:hypothetical protein